MAEGSKKREEYASDMHDLGVVLDEYLNGPADKRVEGRKNGFIVMVFPFNNPKGLCNYLSNADRKDVLALMKKQIARFES